MSEEEKSVGKVHESIALVIANIGAVEKGGKTPQYKYRSYEQVIKALQPLFDEHGLYATTSIDNIQITGQMVTATVTYRVTSSVDGSWVETAVLAQGSDRADKGAYKLMSGAIKYAYGQLFMIPFEGDDPEDPRNDASNYEAAPKQAPEERPKADATFKAIINLNGDRKPLKDCNEEELLFALDNLRAAAGKGDNPLPAKLVTVCEKLFEDNGWNLPPF